MNRRMFMLGLPFAMERFLRIEPPHIDLDNVEERAIAHGRMRRGDDEPVLPDGTPFMLTDTGIALRDDTGCWHVYAMWWLDEMGGVMEWQGVVCEE